MRLRTVALVLVGAAAVARRWQVRRTIAAGVSYAPPPFVPPAAPEADDEDAVELRPGWEAAADPDDAA